MKKLKVSYTEEALKEINSITKGYPFFIQQMCQIVYNRADTKVIEKAHIDSCINEFLETLDNGFF